MTEPAHTERDHAPFSPSASERWIACEAAVPLEAICRAAGQVDEAGPAAECGTLAHEEAEIAKRAGRQHITAGHVRPTTLARWIELGEDPDSYIAAVNEYLGFLARVEARIGSEAMQLGFAKGGADTGIEARVQVQGKDCWGSIDFFAIVALEYLLVVDFKAGAGHIVDPTENAQMMTYAIGLLEKYGWSSVATVELAIVQPRGRQSPEDPTIRVWQTTPARIKEHQKAVKAAIKRAKSTGASERGTPGDHCRWCKGQAICKAKRQQALAVLDDLPPATADDQPLADRIASASPAILATILRKRESIIEFLDSVYAHALQNPPPGFKVVEGQSRAKWVDDEIHVAAKLIQGGMADPFRRTLMTITDCKKAIGAKPFEALDKQHGLTVKPPGKPTLVPVDDPRPAIGAGRAALPDILD